jgi:hypothetical protein
MAVLFLTRSLGRDLPFCVRSLSTGVVHPLVVGHFGYWKVICPSTVSSASVCGYYVAAGTRMFSVSIRN